MTYRKKVMSALAMEPEQAKKLERLHKKTRIPKQVLLREALDLLIAKYERKGLI